MYYSRRCHRLEADFRRPVNRTVQGDEHREVDCNFRLELGRVCARFGGTQSRLCTVLVPRHAGNSSQRAAKPGARGVSQRRRKATVSQRTSIDVIRGAASFSMTSIDVIHGQRVNGELRKIGPFLKKFGELCQAVCYPHCEVAFDEMMVRFEGRVEFVHRKQRKPTGNGIKIYVVCESLTGNTFAFEVDRRNGKTIGNFVLDITGKLQPCFHKIYMDNLFTSVALLKKLCDSFYHRPVFCNFFSLECGALYG